VRRRGRLARSGAALDRGGEQRRGLRCLRLAGGRRRPFCRRFLVEAVAGLALLNAFGGALSGALANASEREAALATFLVTASGVSFFGVGGAFWGLVVGAAVLALDRARDKHAPSRQAKAR